MAKPVGRGEFLLGKYLGLCLTLAVNVSVMGVGISLALLFVTSSGLGRYMPAMFSMHMADHMLLSMLVPILLVLGGPVSLALRALPAAGRGEPA